MGAPRFGSVIQPSRGADQTCIDRQVSPAPKGICGVVLPPATEDIRNAGKAPAANVRKPADHAQGHFGR
jgi:hypothetical protein